jgi:drug/metabolite transporter (DMT)-like permease
MKIVLPLLFATIAAMGNALFAYGQKQSANFNNGLLFVGASALAACLMAFLASPAVGPVQIGALCRHWTMILASGLGLFLTYLGFNLLYSRFGVAPYVLYAVISILTTTVAVGIWVLKEPVNAFHKAAIIAAILAVVLFSLGQNKG